MSHLEVTAAHAHLLQEVSLGIAFTYAPFNVSLYVFMKSAMFLPSVCILRINSAFCFRTLTTTDLSPELKGFHFSERLILSFISKLGLG